jgi:hypothetical protein
VIETPRRRADLAVRRLLYIPDGSPDIPDGSPAASGHDVHGAFTTSVLVSAARCLLTYVVLPFIAPALGLASGVGPWVGIPLSTIAVAANVVSIRRFWFADHRWRWPYSGIGLSVIALLIVLAVGDVAELVR